MTNESDDTPIQSDDSLRLDRKWYHKFPPEHPSHENVARLVDIASQIDPTSQCRFLWEQLYPEIQWSVETVQTWLMTNHGIPASKAPFVDMLTVLELLRSERKVSALEWSNYRTPSEWRTLRKNAGLAYSKRTWTSLRAKHAIHIQGEPGNEAKACRIAQSLAVDWGLKLPEFDF